MPHILGLSFVLASFFISQASFGSPEKDSATLKFVWKNESGEHDLGSFAFSGLPAAALKKSKERDPRNGEVVTWEGISLAWLLDHSIEKLTIEQKAAIDLVVLIGKGGERAMIPRGVVARNPLILATKRSGKDVGDRGPIYSVAPWTSSLKLQQETLPLQKFFVSGLDRIELTNSRLFYGDVFLSKRSDPRAVKGERLFVQACMACHDSGKGQKQFPLTLLKVGDAHKPVEGLPKFTSADLAAVKAYFKKYETEITGTSSSQR